MSKESFICLGGVANKRLALAQALRTDGRTIPKLGYNKNWVKKIRTTGVETVQPALRCNGRTGAWI